MNLMNLMNLMKTPSHSGALHVAFCANDRFLPGLAVALHSTLLSAASGQEVKVYIVDAGLSDESKASLCERYENRSEIDIEFLDWPRDLFDSVKVVNYHISSYLRLSLPELINNEYVIYLDSDTVVFDDIGFMVKELKAGVFPIAASPDWETHRPSQDSKVIAAHAGVEKCDSYFNAGVIALDFEALRAEHFTSRACELLSELGEHASYADQSAFNALLAERWHELPKRWNTPSWAFDKQKSNDLPAILHYTNSAPWLKRRFTPSQALFERIARDLGVELPRPETSLARSCLSAFLAWLLAPLRMVCQLLRATASKASGKREKADDSQKIACFWMGYFFGGPLRVARYWWRICEIKSALFQPFTMKVNTSNIKSL
jgi:lipopolysaccharide biosynthesis glycosyltransferase